jgi:pyruvate,water dikinase
VVDGRETPDHYALDRKGTLKRSRIVGEQVLNENELRQLADLGRKLEEIHGCPQDIEWAFDKSGELSLLQSRPITTI